jgi:tryptophanase
MRTIIEPFRIKAVEPIRMTTREERLKLIEKADYNLFALHSEDVLIDLLTDSGTSAMSAKQQAALLAGDESYAGSPSFFRFEAAVKDLMPFRHVIPTHQGRAAEAILFSILGGPGKAIPSNTHFDTTRGNIESTGASGHDLVIAEGLDPRSDHPFKGNMDLPRLEAFLRQRGDAVPCVMMTVTNNSGGGQPVSLENLRGRGRRSRIDGKPLFLDAAGSPRTPGSSTSASPARASATCATSSATWPPRRRHDHVGQEGRPWPTSAAGWRSTTTNWPASAATCSSSPRVSRPTAVWPGAIWRPSPRASRRSSRTTTCATGSAPRRTWASALKRAGVPVVRPTGGHAVYIDARACCPHIPPSAVPGARAGRGPVRRGRHPLLRDRHGDVRPATRTARETPAPMDLVRMAFPRRTYTQSHMDYVVEVFEEIHARKDSLRGMKITWQPSAMRHFTAKFAPL